MLVDSHAHLNFKDFKEDWQQIIAECQKENLWLINVGSNLETSQQAVAIAKKYDQGVYAVVGLHPIHVEGSAFHPEVFDADEYRALIKSSNKVVAIGETGLDFFHSDKNIANQKKIFSQHLNLAKEFCLPVILHSRNSKDGKKDAYEEILGILRDRETKRSRDQKIGKSASAPRPIRHVQGRFEQVERRQARGFGETKGVIHCFGGTVKQALAFLELGFYIGFTGIITFDKSGQLAEVVKGLPLEAILVETDSPYLAPLPYRGKRNLPQYVRLVAEKIAEIRQIEYNEIEKQTAENTIKLFHLVRNITDKEV